MGTSYRKGLYITDVTKSITSEDVYFKLLRCSTNLQGPTDNFRKIDHIIINKLNDTLKCLYKKPIELNHVLAQVYTNQIINNKQKKAAIKEHSDKTKDMNKDGLIVFCSFYKFDNSIKYRIVDYDYFYKKTSVLTKLRFKLKSTVQDQTLKKTFDVILYPNSVFAISLKTNRLYTHEIVPSGLPVEYLPTRLGYVVRCSDTDAVYKDDGTYTMNKDGSLTKLVAATTRIDKVSELKTQYYLENSTDRFIEYDEVLDFSLNDGDYIPPIL